MAEEQLTGETPVDGEEVAGETPAAGDGFDKERAMETIRKLRSELKQAEKQGRRLRELEEAETAKQQAELSEVEKLKATTAQATQAAEMAMAKLREETLRFEFMLAAMRPGSGIDPAAADAAWKLIDREEIAVDEDGKPKEIGKALKELTRQYPFLAAAKAGQAPDINAGAGGRQNGQQEAAARMDELKRRFRL